MEEFIEISTKDNYIIYGTLNSYEKKKDKLIIFVHGLSGNQHEHQFFNAVSFFCPKGYDTLRFDFYPNEDNARQSGESSVSTHTDDLNTVIEYFKSKYDEICLVGHSLGCLVISNANLEHVSKIVYWDPTCGFKSLEEKDIEYDENLDKYILHWGFESIVSKELVKEWQESYDVEKYSKKLTSNSSIVFAGNADKYDAWKDYVGECQFAIVEGASHRFIEEGTLNKLFEETLKLLEN